MTTRRKIDGEMTLDVEEVTGPNAGCYDFNWTGFHVGLFQGSWQQMQAVNQLGCDLDDRHF